MNNVAYGNHGMNNEIDCPPLDRVVDQGNNAGGKNIKMLADPVDNQDAATKQWVMTLVAPFLQIQTLPGETKLEAMERIAFK
jgi:hypothetical protein